MMPQNFVTSLIFKQLGNSGKGADVVVAEFFGQILGKYTQNNCKTAFCNTGFSCYNCYNSIKKVDNYKDNQAFKVVTSCCEYPYFVTSCYKFVTSCYNRFVTTVN